MPSLFEPPRDYVTPNGHIRSLTVAAPHICLSLNSVSLSQCENSAFMVRFGFAIVFATALYSQDNYEIQVYPAETVPPKATMLELHSNFTFQGSKNVVD